MKNKALLILSLYSIFLFSFSVHAEENKPVEYKGDVIIDSDLDGLTDEGEGQIFQTDLNNPDTDQDGILDGTEIINRTNPLDNTSPSVKVTLTESLPQNSETAWPWYLSRSSALLGFLLLYLSMFFGVSIRISFLKELINPVYSLGIHRWISLQALVFAFIHGTVLIFDKFIGFSWANIFIPFYSLSDSSLKAGIDNRYLALGILAFYLMLVLIITSYLRKFIGYRIWRAIHFMNIVLWVFGVLHALRLGTDLRSPIFRNIFIAANLFLALLFIFNLFSRIQSWVKIKRAKTAAYENLRPSDSKIFPERDNQNFRRRI